MDSGFNSGTLTFSDDNNYLANQTLTISGNSTAIGSASLILNSNETHVNPSITWAYSPSPHISPIEYSFQNSSWKYTICYILSIFFGPWLILWSKITGKSTGFRVRNIVGQEIRRPEDRINSFISPGNVGMATTVTAPPQERDFDE